MCNQVETDVLKVKTVNLHHEILQNINFEKCKKGVTDFKKATNCIYQYGT